jgi:hypothetical protein
MTTSNGRIVRSHLDGGGCTGLEIEHARRFIGTSSNDFGAILKQWRLVTCLVTVAVMCSDKTTRLTGDQQQFKTGASCSKKAFPSL